MISLTRHLWHDFCYLLSQAQAEYFLGDILQPAL